MLKNTLYTVHAGFDSTKLSAGLTRGVELLKRAKALAQLRPPVLNTLPWPLNLRLDEATGLGCAAVQSD